MALEPVRFGVIGTSGHGNRVAAPTINKNPNTRLLGGVGSSYEKSQEFADSHQAPKAYQSVDEMLNDTDIDAVWICSPNFMHGEDARRVTAAGKHALVEKPLSIRFEDAEAAVSAVKAGTILRVGYQHRYRPSHKRIKELLEQGRIGHLGYVRIHRFWTYPYYEDMPEQPPAWRQSVETSGGFVINDIGSHLIDLVQWFAGSHGTLCGSIMASQKFNVETEDSSALLMALGDAVIGIVETSNSNHSPGSRFELYGSDGWIRAENTLTGVGRITTHDGLAEEFESMDLSVPYAWQLEDFVTAIRGGASIGADGADGASNVRIINEAQETGHKTRRNFQG